VARRGKSICNHRGYIGVLHVDHDASVLRGKVVNTRNTITFQGRTVAEATQAFRDSVEDYLEFCKSLGEPPEKPFSGPRDHLAE
jgi:predicted HicB family RNase H-like nuclease